jgi:adenylate kinase family enzyme
MQPSDFSSTFEHLKLPDYKPYSFADIITERQSKLQYVPKQLAKLYANLNGIKNEVVKFNQDWVFQVCGEVGSGKSTLAIQVAMYLDPKFDMSTQLLYDMKDWARFVTMFRDKPFKVMMFDEAVSNLFSRDGMKGESIDLLKWITKARASNYFIIFTIPNPWSLDVKIREERSKTMLFTYKNEDQKNQRHYYAWYNSGSLATIAQREKDGKKLLRNPKKFINTFKPNYLPETFPRLESSVETEYLKYKRTDKNAFEDVLIKKYTTKEKR